MRKLKCVKCGAPMRRTGFDKNQRGDTGVHLRVPEMWIHDEENVEAAADAVNTVRRKV